MVVGETGDTGAGRLDFNLPVEPPTHQYLHDPAHAPAFCFALLFETTPDTFVHPDENLNLLDDA
jgi:hypothetical protein